MQHQRIAQSNKHHVDKFAALALNLFPTLGRPKHNCDGGPSTNHQGPRRGGLKRSSARFPWQTGRQQHPQRPTTHHRDKRGGPQERRANGARPLYRSEPQYEVKYCRKLRPQRVSRMTDEGPSGAGATAIHRPEIAPSMWAAAL